jgi:hypothetical protein
MAGRVLNGHNEASQVFLEKLFLISKTVISCVLSFKEKQWLVLRRFIYPSFRQEAIEQHALKC